MVHRMCLASLMLFKCDQICFGSPVLSLESRLIIELCGLNRLWERTAQKLWKKLRFVENRFVIMMRIEV